LIDNLKKNYIPYLVFFFYIIIGISLSLNTGISHDEIHEQKNWLVNFSAIKDFIKTGNLEKLINYRDKYHGVAFHFLSQPIQYLIKDFASSINDASPIGGLLIAKHPTVFLVFSISGIFFYLIILKITQNKNFSLLASLIYLLYPYLFGHAQFNPKDIPFLSFWLINTFFSLRIIEDLYLEKKIHLNKFIFLAFLTAFLISIRVIGLIIIIQYIISFFIYLEKSQNNFFQFVKNNFKRLLTFLISFFLFIYFLNPIFWQNPLEIINSIKWMSKYPQNICTLTNGSCMYSLNLPSSYYFIWLFYKLPLLALFGYCLFPFVESKIFNNNISSIYYGTITITAPVIIVLFILNEVALYDELRHIMFLIPLIILTSFVNLFYFIKKKILTYLFLFVAIFFIFENFNLNPYQYTWMNSFAKFKNIEKSFEVDYWGISNKNLQKKIINYVDQKNINKNICIYGDLYAKEFLVSKNFSCFKTYTQLDNAEIRPFIAYKNLRNVKRSNPKDCKLIWNETYSYTFYKKKISVGTLWYCD
jgi:hypothetical protein